MKKIGYLALSIFLFSVLQSVFLSSFLVKTDLISNIITFLSIIFGFYITSLSIFVTSKYVSSLYKTGDKNNKSTTLLHTLFNNYKFGLLVTLFSIIYFLSIHFVINQTQNGQLSLSNILLIPFIGIVVNNFWYSFAMLRDLINVILQEVKNLK